MQNAQLPGSRRSIAALGTAALLCGGIVAAALFLNRPTALRPPSLAAPDCATPVKDSGSGFAVELQVANAKLPASLKEQILSGTALAYAQWSEWLGADAMSKAPIKILFLGDAEQFKKIYGKPNGQDWTTTGFYRVSNNEVFVLYTPEYRATGLANAFHEVSHLITAWQLGATPPWLNEGLAEHYETLQVSAEGSRFLLNVAHLQMLRSKGPVPIDTITQLSRQEWLSKDAERRYASAWSLTAFLMDSDRGQQTLKQVMQTAHAQRCAIGPALSTSLTSYPGGLASLQSDWFAWLDARYELLPKTQSAGATAP